MQNKIYVGNLNYTSSDQDIRQCFSEFGEISEIVVPQDRETGRPRGFAFVTFATDEEAQKALSMDGKDFMGRMIKVNIAKAREDRSGGGSRGRSNW